MCKFTGLKLNAMDSVALFFTDTDFRKVNFYAIIDDVINYLNLFCVFDLYFKI